MATATITIRLDSGLKAQAEGLFDSMGMNMTTALTVFMKAAVREGRIPFEIKGDPFYSDENQNYLARVIRDMDAGVHCAEHPLIEVEP